MTRIEIPIEDARPGDIAVLKAPRWPTEVEAELYEWHSHLAAAGYVLRYSDGSSGTHAKRVYREVPDLPTEPGSIIRATIRGVPDTMAMLDDDGDWHTNARIVGFYGHRPDRIDLSTVVVGRVVFDGDAS